MSTKATSMPCPPEAGRPAERFRAIPKLLLAGVMALGVSPATASAAMISSNWAGYVAHHAGVKFRSVAASWKEPVPACGAPFPGYSSTWVGLGGFRASSSALEQIGVELDCRSGGGSRALAWYELVPEPALLIRMTIRPGDTIRASVTVTGRRTGLKLTDVTRHEAFSRTIRAPAIDVTSADWIVEAPSVCFLTNLCRTLPLANFGTVSFAGATATTTARRRGAISSPLWTATQISLLPSSRSFVFSGDAARATPSPLSTDGSAFAVTSAQRSGNAAPAAPTPAAAVASVGPNQPGGQSR